METFTRVSGKMAKLTVSESLSIKTVACMKAVGKMTCSMGTDARAGTTGKFNSTENFEKERKQDLEDLNSKVDTMKVWNKYVSSPIRKTIEIDDKFKIFKFKMKSIIIAAFMAKINLI